MMHRYIQAVVKKVIAGAAVCLLGLLGSVPAISAPSDSMQAAGVKLTDGTTMYFRLYVPRSYTPSKKYPIVVTLHGVGEKGTDNRIQVDREEITRLWMQDTVQKKYAPFILSPQCPSSMGWAGGDGSAGLADNGVVKVLDSLNKVYSLDTTRWYVAGLSMGGAGTWGMVKSYPKRFAAVIPCAGAMGWNPDFTVSMIDGVNTAKTPYWAFHGTADDIVLPLYSRRIDTAVVNAGFPVVHYTSSAMRTNPTGISNDSLWKAVSGGALYLYSEITGGDHKAGWMEAWYHPMMVQWLFSKLKVNGAALFTWPAPDINSTPVVVAGKPPGTSSATIHGGNGGIRWSGMSSLPARMNVYSVSGKLIMRKSIERPEGWMTCPGLAQGAYCLSVTTPRGTEKLSIMVSGSRR